MWRGSFGNLRSSWQEMERLRREMNRLFDTVPGNTGLSVARGYPTMNIWANEDGLLVTAELPGIEVEDIEISVVNDTLTLTGARKAEELAEGAQYHRRERGCGKFSRSLQLPYQVDTDNVEAVFDEGVLSITLPRSEADKPRKISVRAA